MFFRLLVPAFRTFIHLISGMAKPITSISWIALRSAISIPLPPLVASLGMQRLRVPIVSLSSNSTTHRPHHCSGPLFSLANTLVVSSHRRSGADSGVDRVHSLSMPKPSATPHQHDNSLLHRPFIVTDLRDSSAGARISCKRIATWLIGKMPRRGRCRSRLSQPLLERAD